MNKAKRKDITGFLLGLGILILINAIGSAAFYRLDLTSEKRYSISAPTKELISNLKEDLLITVYLEGNFPASFKRLRNETREMLDEFQAYSDGKISFNFINPSASPDNEERNQVYKNLYDKGLKPTDLNIKDDDGVSKKVVWPGAIVSYQEKEVPVQLLKSQFGAPPEVVLNQSIESLEYELAFAIKKITTPFIQKIAFIEGHGELGKYETADIVGSLREFYEVERVKIEGNISSLSRRMFVGKDSTEMSVSNLYDAIVIAGPDSAFSEKDKFIVDQFIMRGGKAIWLVDQVEANMDSLNPKNNFTTLAFPKELNLADQLFKYGVRFNNDLIQDLRAAPIPVVSGQYGNQAQTQLYPWLYYPLLFSKNNHPINKNLDVVKVEFASSIDLVGDDGLKKTVVLSTSENTKLVKAPTRVSLNMLSYEPPAAQYTKKNIPVGVLVEGEFSSVYSGRLAPNIINSGEIQFIEKSEPTQQLFISDENVIRNLYNEKSNEFYALGFDKYTKQVYGNKSFFINAVNFMVDESDLILSNDKSFKIRLLNTQLIDDNRFVIQLINTAAPIGLIVLIGLLLNFIRRRKYTV
ncbi:MAG: gliding motility-associated ABC transporter substrate-binding protein GldG [Vicingaceae bacterium]